MPTTVRSTVYDEESGWKLEEKRSIYWVNKEKKIAKNDLKSVSHVREHHGTMKMSTPRGKKGGR